MWRFGTPPAIGQLIALRGPRAGGVRQMQGAQASMPAADAWVHRYGQAITK
jgi:hypothetical protein